MYKTKSSIVKSTESNNQKQPNAPEHTETEVLIKNPAHAL